VARLPHVLRTGFCIVIKLLARAKYSVQIRLNVDRLERILVREFPTQGREIYSGVHHYLEEETENEELGRLFEDPTGVRPRTYCVLGLDCPYKSNCRSGPVDDHFPRCHIDNCNYAVPLHQELPGYTEYDYVLVLRDKCYRDVLLMPQVNRGSLPHSNFQMVCDPSSWQTVLKTAKKVADAVGLSVNECFAEWHVNFGNWESAIAHNPGTYNCHAHFHFLLARDSASTLGQLHPAFYGFLDIPDDDDHQRECEKLRARLPVSHLSAQVTQVNQDVAQLKADVTQLKTDVTQLKTGVTEIRDLLLESLGRG